MCCIFLCLFRFTSFSPDSPPLLFAYSLSAFIVSGSLFRCKLPQATGLQDENGHTSESKIP